MSYSGADLRLRHCFPSIINKPNRAEAIVMSKRRVNCVRAILKWMLDVFEKVEPQHRAAVLVFLIATVAGTDIPWESIKPLLS